jgi:hypothetical protein
MVPPDLLRQSFDGLPWYSKCPTRLPILKALHTGQIQRWKEERAERKRREDAFWNRLEDEIRRDLVIPEEDIPAKYRGGPRRWFRSANVVDLVRRLPKPAPDER